MSTPDIRWWRPEAEGRRHLFLAKALADLKSDQAAREADMLTAWRLFSAKPVIGLGPETYRRLDARSVDRLPVNVVQRVIRSLLAETAQQKPRPMALTSGGDYELRERAEGLTKWFDGLFYAVDFDKRIAPMVERDALSFCTGFSYWYEDPHEKRLCCERVFPGEIMLDEQEAIYGSPRTVYRRRFFDRRVLAELYPDAASDILMAPQPSSTAWWSKANQDQVCVVYGWHLPSKPGAGDGQWIVAVEGAGAVLDSGEWDEDWFPFCWLHWDPPVLGFWGSSVTELVMGGQYELNRLNKVIRIAEKLGSVLRLMVPRQGDVQEGGATNEQGGWLFFNAPHAPIQSANSGVHPELYNQRAWHIRNAYDEVGLPELAVTSQMPAGLAGNASAQLVYADQKSKRFLTWLDAVEGWYMANARTAARMMRRLSSQNAAYEVVYRDDDSVEKIDWQQVNLDESEYLLVVFPTSQLPNTPAGRLAALDNLMNRQVINRETYMRLLKWPDLESEMNLLAAPRKIVERIVGKMLKGGPYAAPSQYLQLDLAIYTAGLMLLDAEDRGAPEERLALVRQWIEECDAIALEQAAKNAPPPAPALSPDMAAPVDPTLAAEAALQPQQQVA